MTSPQMIKRNSFSAASYKRYMVSMDRLRNSFHLGNFGLNTTMSTEHMSGPSLVASGAVEITVCVGKITALYLAAKSDKFSLTEDEFAMRSFSIGLSFVSGSLMMASGVLYYIPGSEGVTRASSVCGMLGILFGTLANTSAQVDNAVYAPDFNSQNGINPTGNPSTDGPAKSNTNTLPTTNTPPALSNVLATDATPPTRVNSVSAERSAQSELRISM